MIRNTWSLGSRRRVLVLGQLGVLSHLCLLSVLPVSSVCLVFVCGPPKADDLDPPKADRKVSTY